MKKASSLLRLPVFWFAGGLMLAYTAGPAFAQDHEVTGAVVSAEDGEALPGANIVVKGTQVGVTTGATGEYSISVPSPEDTLVFSFVGFQTQEIPVDERSEIDVLLLPHAVIGDELIVVGYGAIERRDVTGAITSISSREIQELPVTDAAQALQGRASGVVALSSGNRPGEGVEVRIRGRRSLTASNDPLFVVDGIPLEGNLNDINPRDIESIEVLKDASATAIYGSRGANGVVLVTTSRGGDHPTRVSYSGHGGVRQVLGRPDMMSGEEFARVKEVGGRAFSQAEIEALEAGISTDYQDLLFETGYQQNHQLSITGGDASTRFSVSANYFDEQGIIRTQGFNRYSFRVNLDHFVSDRFRIGTSTLLANQAQDWANNPYGSALATNPLSTPFDAAGNLIFRPGADPLIWNPLADLEPNAVIDERTRLRVFSNIFAEVDVLPNLHYRMNFGPDFQNARRGVFLSSLSSARQENPPFVQIEHNRSFTYTFENILNYTHAVRNIHQFDVTGLFSLQESHDEYSNVEGSGLPYESSLFHNIGNIETVEERESDLQEWGIMSFMGRINYRFLERYLLTVTGRFDGSSRLAEANRWGFFPSAALGWRINDEAFMDGLTLFSDLRLRVSYGLTGNTAIQPYQTRGALARTIYSFGDTPGIGFRPNLIPNPDLRWESSATFNVGLDFGLWDDRIVGAFEVYQTNTTDLLLERQLPPSSGHAFVLENIGETRNRGFEIMLSTRNVSTPDFSWTTDLNFFGNREEILALYGTGEDDVGNEWFIGRPLTVWYDFEKIGIWQWDEAEEAARFGQDPGQIRVRDVNDDGLINEQDRVILGSDMPTLTGGITNRFRYRNVDLSVFMFGSFGHTVFNNFRVQNSTLQGRYNNLNVDYWVPPTFDEDGAMTDPGNPTHNDPMPDTDRENPLYGSTRGYYSGDFLKIRNVQLGYNLPSTMLTRLGVQSVRLYVNADTPFVASHLEGGVDPEISGGQVQGGNVPTSTLYTAGVSINF